MRVRMKVEVSGTRNGAAWPRVGGMLEVADDEGAALCASGMADPVVEDKTEKAVAAPAEKRTGKRAR